MVVALFYNINNKTILIRHLTKTIAMCFIFLLLTFFTYFTKLMAPPSDLINEALLLQANTFLTDFSDTQEQFFSLLIELDSKDLHYDCKLNQIKNHIQKLVDITDSFVSDWQANIETFENFIGIEIDNQSNFLICNKKITIDKWELCLTLSQLFFIIMEKLDLLSYEKLYNLLTSKTLDVKEINYTRDFLNLTKFSNALKKQQASLQQNIFVKFIIFSKQIMKKLALIIYAWKNSPQKTTFLPPPTLDNDPITNLLPKHSYFEIPKCYQKTHKQKYIIFSSTYSSQEAKDCQDIHSHKAYLSTYLSQYDKKIIRTLFLCLARAFSKYNNLCQTQIFETIILLIPPIPSSTGRHLDIAQKIYSFIDWEKLFLTNKPE